MFENQRDRDTQPRSTPIHWFNPHEPVREPGVGNIEQVYLESESRLPPPQSTMARSQTQEPQLEVNLGMLTWNTVS